MKLHWTFLPMIIIGVAIGTLIALVIAAEYAKGQVASLESSNPLLSAL